MKLEGVNTNPTISGADKLPGIVNYFIGSNPQNWRTNIPTYKKVEYKDIYPGIDLAYYGNHSIYLVKTETGKIVQVSAQNRLRSARRVLEWDEHVYLSWDLTSSVVLTQ